jgi:hypothetical protein
MPNLIVLDSIAILRRLLFIRLAETNADLIRVHSDLAVHIDGRHDEVISSLLGDIENRIQAMRNIMAVLDEYRRG